MTTKENLTTAFDGGTPDRTPFSFYSWMHPEMLGIDAGDTPAGSVQKTLRNGWHVQEWLQEPGDYLVWKWIVDHTEQVPRYDRFQDEEERIGDTGICVVLASRTPALTMNVDLACVMRCCTDMATETDEFAAFYDSLLRLFRVETRMVADGPGHFVKWLENLTAPVFGPRYYGELVVPVSAPFHIIESLSEAPEGDLGYDECRSLWPEKAFWRNINVGPYHEPTDNLQRAVAGKLERAGRLGFAFEISEHTPKNWRTTIPEVLEVLRYAQPGIQV